MHAAVFDNDFGAVLAIFDENSNSLLVTDKFNRKPVDMSQSIEMKNLISALQSATPTTMKSFLCYSSPKYNGMLHYCLSSYHCQSISNPNDSDN